MPTEQNLLVTGLVSSRDHTPRIQIDDANGRRIAQMDAEDAIHLALDIIKMAEATMADALLVKWCHVYLKEGNDADHMAVQLLQLFRDFRAELEDDSRTRNPRPGGT